MVKSPGIILTKYLSAVLVLKLFALFAISSFPNRSNAPINTSTADKYLVKMMPGENIKLNGQTSKSENKDKVYTKISIIICNYQGFL
jgi:hypothetical protein